MHVHNEELYLTNSLSLPIKLN